MLYLYVAADLTRVEGLDKKAQAELQEALSFKVPGYIFTTAYRKYGWDGSKTLMKGPNQFSTGLLQRATQHFDFLDWPYRIVEDLRPQYPEHVFCNPFGLRDFQHAVLDQVLRHRRGIVAAPPRSGKTIVAIELYRRTSLRPFVYIVWQVEVAQQAAEKFRKLLPGVKVGLVADGKADTSADVVIATFQSLAVAHGLNVERRDMPKQRKRENPLPRIRYEQVRRACRAARTVVWDEAHHAASAAAQQLGLAFQDAAYVLGLSATPWREDNADIALESVVGPILYHMSYKEAADAGIILPLYVTVFALSGEDFAILGGYQDAYKQAIVDNDRYHKIVASVVHHLRRKGNTVAVIVGQVQHGRHLERKIKKSFFIHGKSTGEERQQGFRHISERDGVCLISTLIDEAVDLPALDAIVVADVKKSAIKTFQRLRSMTVAENKRRATAVFFAPDVSYLDRHADRTVRFLRSEQPPFRVFRRRIHADGKIGPLERLRPTKRPDRKRHLTLLPGATEAEREAARSGIPDGA